MIVSYNKDRYPDSDVNATMSIEYPTVITSQDQLVGAVLDNSPFILEGKDIFLRRGMINHNKVVQKIRFDFFDDFMEKGTFEEYLDSEESDYRATLPDGIIIRMSNDDYKNYLERQIDLSGAPTLTVGYEEPEFESSTIEKPKGKLKRRKGRK